MRDGVARLLSVAGCFAFAIAFVPSALATVSGTINDPVATDYAKPLSFEGENIGRIGSGLGSGLDVRSPATDLWNSVNRSASFSSSADTLDPDNAGHSQDKDGLKMLIAILVLLGATRKYLTSAKYQEFLDGVYGPLDGY